MGGPKRKGAVEKAVGRTSKQLRLSDSALGADGARARPKARRRDTGRREGDLRPRADPLAREGARADAVGGAKKPAAKERRTVSMISPPAAPPVVGSTGA
jgi:hypothetical protein